MVTRIGVLVLDVDGVLTDGTTEISGAGDAGKRICFLDLDAVTTARAAGLELALITAEDSAAVDLIAQRFGIERVIRGAKDKGTALRALAEMLGVDSAEICYVGDGDRDGPALRLAGLGLAPANATPSARAAADRVLEARGGGGAVAEAVALMMTLRRQADGDGVLATGIRAAVEASLAAHRRLVEEAVPVLVQITAVLLNVIERGHKVFLFGNGGSAADAQHVAGELVGRFALESNPWPAIALTTDSSILTAIGNDYGFEQVFSRQLKAIATPGDVAVGISTSGSARNVLRGLEVAEELGCMTLGFSGEDPKAMRGACDLLFCAPATVTPRIQELHIAAWHAVCEMLEAGLMQSGCD